MEEYNIEELMLLGCQSKQNGEDFPIWWKMHAKDLILIGSNLCVCTCLNRYSGYCVDIKGNIHI